MSLVPGRGNTVDGSAQATDDRSVAFLLVETVCLITVHIVQGGDGARIDGSPSIDAEWEGNRKETELERHSPQWGEMHLQDAFTNRQGTK